MPLHLYFIKRCIVSLKKICRKDKTKETKKPQTPTKTRETARKENNMLKKPKKKHRSIYKNEF